MLEWKAKRPPHRSAEVTPMP